MENDQFQTFFLKRYIFKKTEWYFGLFMGLVDIVNLPMLYIKRENLSEWKNKKKTNGKQKT